jgi:uncharacterized paraquat-inducible protein A
MMKKRLFLNGLALILLLISFGLLIPGIFLPVMTITGVIKLPMLGTLELGSETRSILGTVKYLYDSGNFLVSALIFIFSVTVPFIKGCLLIFVLFPGASATRELILSTIRRIGKWSMADVFVVAVFLAYLASASMEVFQARLERGYYFFLGYCLISVLATEFIILKRKS